MNIKKSISSDLNMFYQNIENITSLDLKIITAYLMSRYLRNKYAFIDLSLDNHKELKDYLIHKDVDILHQENENHNVTSNLINILILNNNSSSVLSSILKYYSITKKEMVLNYINNTKGINVLLTGKKHDPSTFVRYIKSEITSKYHFNSAVDEINKVLEKYKLKIYNAVTSFFSTKIKTINEDGEYIDISEIDLISKIFTHHIQSSFDIQNDDLKNLLKKYFEVKNNIESKDVQILLSNFFTRLLVKDYTFLSNKSTINKQFFEYLNNHKIPYTKGIENHVLKSKNNLREIIDQSLSYEEFIKNLSFLSIIKKEYINEYIKLNKDLCMISKEEYKKHHYVKTIKLGLIEYVSTNKMKELLNIVSDYKLYFDESNIISYSNNQRTSISYENALQIILNKF